MRKNVLIGWNTKGQRPGITLSTEDVKELKEVGELTV